MSRLIDENTIIKMLNAMDRYTSEELTLCDTDKTFPKNEVFIVDDVFEGLDELPSAQPEQNVLAWLLSYHTQAFELKGRYLPHEVIGWLVNDFCKAFMAERREENDQ